jgi:hypothetical protein
MFIPPVTNPLPQAERKFRKALLVLVGDLSETDRTIAMHPFGLRTTTAFAVGKILYRHCWRNCAYFTLSASINPAYKMPD